MDILVRRQPAVLEHHVAQIKNPAGKDFVLGRNYMIRIIRIMVDSAWSNESWLRPLLCEALGQEPVASLATDGKPLWEAVVASGLMSDDKVLSIASQH